LSVAAQFGEDELLLADFGDSGYYVEVGAADGIENSNTELLERHGWTGVLIEADPDRADACRAARPNSRVVSCAVVAPGTPQSVTFYRAEIPGLSTIGLTETGRGQLQSWTGRVALVELTVPARTLDSILQERPLPRIDVVTIDVEGHEAGVLRGFDLRRWRPRTVIVERNRSFPDPTVVRLLLRGGYKYQRTTGVNEWWTVCGSTSAGLVRLASLYLNAVRCKAARLLRRAP
jgi:FkbM family methyltransferase